MTGRLLAILALVPACYMSGSQGPPGREAATPPDVPGEPRFVPPLRLTAGTIEGEIEGEGSFGGPATTLEGWDYEGVDLLHVGTHDASSAAMLVLEIVGDVDHPEIVPGATLAFGPEGLGETLLEAHATGCVGDTPGEWSFERSPERLELRVAPGPDAHSMRIGFDATFVQAQILMRGKTERPLGSMSGWFEVVP